MMILQMKVGSFLLIFADICSLCMFKVHDEIANAHVHEIIILSIKEKRDHPARYRRIINKHACVVVWGCSSTHGVEYLHMCASVKASFMLNN